MENKANFLNPNWWDTATVGGIKAEIAKGADANSMNDIALNHALKKIRNLINEAENSISELNKSIEQLEKSIMN